VAAVPIHANREIPKGLLRKIIREDLEMNLEMFLEMYSDSSQNRSIIHGNAA
jgi:hypothetical protein